MSRLAICLGGKVALQGPRVELRPWGAVLDEGAALPAVDEFAAVGRERLQAAVVVAWAERRRRGGALYPAARQRLPLRLCDSDLRMDWHRYRT